MKPHPRCALTHSLIAAGRCFFCGEPTLRGEIVPDGAEACPPVLQWDVSAMVAALSSDNNITGEAISSVFCHKGDLFAELPFMRVALSHPNRLVRRTAEHIPSIRSRAFQAEDAERCEQHLQSHPSEFALRLALLGYYFLRSCEFPIERAARERHILWVIEHRPSSDAAGSPDCYLFSDAGEPYRLARNLWLRHTDSSNVQADVLGNAAGFFTLNEPNLSEQLFRRAKELQPENPEWSNQLGHLFHLRYSRCRPEERIADASRALEQFEDSLQISSSHLDRASALIDLAKTAYDAGKWERSRQAAEKLLDVAAEEHNPADMLHAAHCVLGRLSLKEGDVSEAKRRLFLAAKALVTKDRIHAPGPRELWLARELLERGERRAVTEYLEQCSPAWQSTNHCGEVWASAIKRGEMPDFGHYLE